MLFLYGGYGCGNHGDDLICKAALLMYPNSKVFALYTYPKISINRNDVYITNEDPDKVIEVLTKHKHLNPKLKFAGGGLFWSREHIEKMHKIAKFCFENKIEVTIERVGLHGAQYYPEKSLEFLEMMSYISVRDRSSSELILGMGLNIDIPIHIAYCFTVMLPKLIHFKQQKPICYINLSLWLQNSLNETISLIKMLIDKFPSIQFIYLIQTRHIKSHHSEERFRDSLSPLLSIVNPETSEEYYDLFKNASFVISSGYHSAFLPIINNIPVFQVAFGVDNQTKYLAIAKEMKIDHYVQSVYQKFNTKKIFDKICIFLQKNISL